MLHMPQSINHQTHSGEVYTTTQYTSIRIDLNTPRSIIKAFDENQTYK